MTPSIPGLIVRNLSYYWRTNLAVLVGVAIAVAVLTGALLVGDSVRGSLRDLVLVRLGSTTHAISSSGFFREELASEIQSQSRFTAEFTGICPLIVMEGLVTHQESGRRGSRVQVYGVDERFWSFHEIVSIGGVGDRDVFVSPGLAGELECKQGDSLLVKVEKPSAIPAESLHGRKDDTSRSIRLTVRALLGPAEMGEFSLRPQQGSVRAVFVPLRRLQKDLDLAGTVNTLLLSAVNDTNPANSIRELVTTTFSLRDIGLKSRLLERQNCISVETESALLNDSLSEQVRRAADELGLRTTSVLTYLANGIRSGAHQIPYSLVTALDREALARLTGADEIPETPPGGRPVIFLNQWAARELRAKQNDTVTLEYYVWKDQGGIETRTAEFQLTGVLPLEGAAADRDFAPEYPGITETESLADWDPPFPMDLSRIRPGDEEYWDRYRTTPKAFVLLEDGQRLWRSRYGGLTSMRVIPRDAQRADTLLPSFEQRLKSTLDPFQMGAVVDPVRDEGLEASQGATDFGEYFLYFSFFIVVSGLLLTGLFFKLGVEQRLREIGLLTAIGFTSGRIRSIFLIEGAVLSAAGSVLGLVAGLGYSALIMFGLRTWWVDAVGTTLLSLHVSALSMMIGGIAGVVTALVCIALALRMLARLSPRSLITGAPGRMRVESAATGHSMGESTLRVGAFTTAMIGLLLVAAAWLEVLPQVPAFFGAGALLLLAMILYLLWRLRRPDKRLMQGVGWWAVSRMGFRSVTYRPGRSVLCIALIACATFIIVAVDAFRRSPGAEIGRQNSGTGGFPLLAESLLPIHYDLNSSDGRDNVNLGSSEEFLRDTTVTRFRARPGDDASCLNLYQPRNPRILGAGAEFTRSGRFAFKESLAENVQNAKDSWLLLEQQLPDGVVPVIADANSMAYVLHAKLGDEIQISAGSPGPIRMRIVAALEHSIFQGELLMSEANFRRLFPDHEGYRFFLIDVEPERSSEVAAHLEERLSDFGFDAISTAEKLAGFYRVENTYLSTFQALGGLGLVLGTLGLGTVLLRNVLERRRDLALLRAVGYRRSHFRVLVLAENAVLVGLGLITGSVCALLAIFPAFTARGGGFSAVSMLVLLAAVVAAGFIGSIAATYAALRSPLLSALRAE